MINRYITVTVHYRYQISNNRTNPEHLINREIQSTEYFKTEAQFFLLWPTTRRSKPSSPLRPHADILLLRCVPTHCSFNCSAFCCFRDASRNTIAPRLLLQGRTQKHYRVASFATGSHPKTLSRRVLLLQGRTQKHHRAASFCFRDAPEP